MARKQLFEPPPGAAPLGAWLDACKRNPSKPQRQPRRSGPFIEVKACKRTPYNRNASLGGAGDTIPKLEVGCPS